MGERGGHWQSVPGQQGGGAGAGRQIPGRAGRTERRGETALPYGPAIKSRNTPARLPPRFPTPGKCTSHLGFGLGSWRICEALGNPWAIFPCRTGAAVAAQPFAARRSPMIVGAATRIWEPAKADSPTPEVAFHQYRAIAVPFAWLNPCGTTAGQSAKVRRWGIASLGRVPCARICALTPAR